MRRKKIIDNTVEVEFTIGCKQYILTYDLELDSIVDVGLNKINIIKGRGGRVYARYHRDSKYGCISVSTIIGKYIEPNRDVFSIRNKDGNPLNLRLNNLDFIFKVNPGELVSDYELIEIDGFKVVAKCKGCGRLRRTGISNIKSSPKCRNCKRGSKKASKLDQSLKLLGSDTNGFTIACINGHEFKRKNLEPFTSRTNKCPICQGSKITIDNVISSLHHGYSLAENTEYVNNTCKFCVICSVGHLYWTNYSKLKKGYKCSTCSSSKPLTELDKVNNILGKGYNTANILNHRVTITCKEGHARTINMNNALYEPYSCSSCNSSRQSSLIEHEVRKWIPAGVEIRTNVRNIIPPYELDIYIPSHMLAIEINGAYYHSTKMVGKHKHHKKFTRCKDKGINLITIFDYEITNEPHKFERVIKDYILGFDIYDRGNTIPVDNRFPILSTEGYELTDTIESRPVMFGGIEVYDCGGFVFKKITCIGS